MDQGYGDFGGGRGGEEVSEDLKGGQGEGGSDYVARWVADRVLKCRYGGANVGEGLGEEGEEEAVGGYEGELDQS